MNLVEPLLDSWVTIYVTHELIYLKAADCDALRDRLVREWGVDIISPHRKNRVRLKQDGIKLRRYKRS